MTFDSGVFNRLAKKISETDATTTGHVRSGGAQDHADYRDRVGYLRALDHVREWMGAIESDLRQGK